MKFKIKYRVVGPGRNKRKYSVILDEGGSFQLTSELLSGVAEVGGPSTPMCALTVREGALHATQASDRQALSLNGKPCREFAVRSGDFLQVAEFYIEILEAPHHSKEDEHETRFLDVSDLPQRAQRAAPARQRPSHVAEERTVLRRTPATEDVTGFLRSPGGHIGTSLVIALLASACISRIIGAATHEPPAASVLYGAPWGVAAVLALALGSTKINRFLDTGGSFDDYALFYAWTLAGGVPWAYALRLQPPLAIFLFLVLASIVTIAFIVRYRPRTDRFLASSVGISCALAFAVYGVSRGTQPEARQAPPIQVEYAGEPPHRSPAAPVSEPSYAVSVESPGLAAQPRPAAVQIAGTAPSPALSPARAPASTDLGVAASPGDPLAVEELFAAIKSDDLALVKSLVERRVVNPDFSLYQGDTALIYAAMSGRLPIVDYLLSKKVNIDAQDPNGTTALMWAVFRGHTDVARLLVKRGAKADIRRDDGDRAVDIAKKWRRRDLVPLLERASR